VLRAIRGLVSFEVGVGLGLTAVFVFALVAEFFGFANLSGSALWAEPDGFGHVAGFDAVFVGGLAELVG
jgi:hypothetical protein